MLQIAKHHVESDGRTGMAQMAIAIHCGAANVHAHMFRIQRNKEFLLARKRIMYVKLLFHIIVFFLLSNNCAICGTTEIKFKITHFLSHSSHKTVFSAQNSSLMPTGRAFPEEYCA